MKINKMSQSLALIPLLGMISLMGTLPAMATECSMLSSCVPASSSLSDSPDVKLTAPLVPSITDRINPATDNVTSSVTEVAAPISETINKVTAPVVDAVDNVVTPTVPLVPIVREPIVVPPEEPVAVAAQPSSPADTAFVSPQDTNAVGVMPAVASETTDSALLHESAAVTAGALSLLNFQPAAIHSSQGTITKIRSSGAFGFGHLNPVDDPVAFGGLLFAYIIVLGSAIGFAVKRSAFLNLRGFA